MLGILLLAFSLPIIAFAWIWWTVRPPAAAWRTYAQRIGLLFGIGLLSAGPFLTDRALGTSEAYNYSLSVADAVTQFRAGVFPVLVGQSEYAFNGRIHPLRTAPYLAYFSGALDVFSFHRLSFWSLQNLALALSLIGGAFSFYACVRRSTPAGPRLALVLSAAYVLAPGVLAPAYGMDLYMTVMTIPFVPIAIACCVRTFNGCRSFGNYAMLVAALAACWLAHPPVALWISVGVVLTQLPLVFLGRMRGPAWLALAGAAVLGGCLAVFAFASVLTIKGYGDVTAVREPGAVVEQVKLAFSDSLRPVSATAAHLGDFQLGYAYWGLLVLAIVYGGLRRERNSLILGFIAVFYLALTTPVPGVNAWLWDHIPTFAITLTSQWPMQRLYLLVTAFALFAFANLPPPERRANRPKFLQDGVIALVAIASIWTTYQAWHFIGRGYASHQDAAQTARSHRPENIDLTLISYAMLGPPSYFVNGVIDPAMEYRLFRRTDLSELASNWSASQAVDLAHAVRGAFTVSGAEGDFAPLRPPLKLEPGAHYRLDFAFRALPQKLTLQFNGPHFRREYLLPEAGRARGFGMLPGNNHSLTLWSTAESTEMIDAQLVASGIGSARLLNFADFTFSKMDPSKLPVVLKSLVPLRLHVTSPDLAMLETPRLYIDGYEARVNGQKVPLHLSPDRLLMFPVPAGESDVEVRYVASPLLRASFWVSFVSWIGFFLAAGASIFRPTLTTKANDGLRTAGSVIWRSKLYWSAALIAVVAATYGWKRWSAYRNAAGPLRIRLMLPRGETNRSQPLVTTGRPQAGTFLFIIYQDSSHIRVGMDVWGQAYWVSEPIPADYYSEQEFVVTSGALYPSDHPKLRGLSPAEIDALKKHIRVDFNGRTVLDQTISSYDSKISEVTVGESRIGGSNTEPRFVGKILSVERLPVPRHP